MNPKKIVITGPRETCKTAIAKLIAANEYNEKPLYFNSFEFTNPPTFAFSQLHYRISAIIFDDIISTKGISLYNGESILVDCKSKKQKYVSTPLIILISSTVDESEFREELKDVEVLYIKTRN
jgi:predicted AAA+ superfamily ATPase